ncbi:MAG: hypothetical protein QNJ00_02525 [Woeseiaceae bacterium]|nr:hypothetical protein [Woeseiaceae bacterium]
MQGHWRCWSLVALVFSAATAQEAEPPGAGPHPVGTTNLRVAVEHDLGDERMHAILLGQGGSLNDILEHPEAAFIVNVQVPGDSALYGPASGQALPVVNFIAYPSAGRDEPNRYRFPYEDGQYGDFEDMLEPGEAPDFADPAARYPLVLLAHGASAHGLYDVRHAQAIASHGYIVAVLNYADDRTALSGEANDHVSFLRPLLTKAVVDALLESDTFGPHIDADNIGITGHSFGGFTSLAVSGGRFKGNPASVTD